jgi:hypothetical protein
MKLLNRIARTLDRTIYNNLINNLFKEVADDINFLKDNFDNLNLDIYEEEDLIIKIKDITAKKYKETYCPNSLFEYFNQSEKANYIMLRVEIDKLLGIKDTSYKI